MTKRRFLPPSSALRTSLILLAVLLAACAPAASPVAPVQPVDVEPGVSPSVPAPTLDSSTQATAAPIESLPVATSRGPELHATDPATVSLASGQLQVVEFFRFT